VKRAVLIAAGPHSSATLFSQHFSRNTFPETFSRNPGSHRVILICMAEEKTVRTVFCAKLQKELPGLDETPFDTHPLGKRIYDNVSKEAWKQWVEHMKMIMNEYRLNLANPEAQEFLLKQMEEYFFGKGSELPPDFKPQ
jgi:Fe-S cluster biosynthesis and repair protein YggX